MLTETRATFIGPLTITVSDGAVKELRFFERGVPGKELSESRSTSHLDIELSRRVFSELEEYFRGERKNFDIPLAPEGTDFQKAVWKKLTEIPYGETRTYGSLMGPRFSRAVGGACNANPIIILIPCHRVIGSDGSLTGFACGIEKKKLLLGLERL